MNIPIAAMLPFYIQKEKKNFTNILYFSKISCRTQFMDCSRCVAFTAKVQAPTMTLQLIKEISKQDV
jgi:hypothetical protein